MLPILSSSFFSMELWFANFLGKGQMSKFNPQRVEGKSQNWEKIFPQNFSWFRTCNSITRGQYFQNEVSVERSIYDDVAAYQLNSLN